MHVTHHPNSPTTTNGDGDQPTTATSNPNPPMTINNQLPHQTCQQRETCNKIQWGAGGTTLRVVWAWAHKVRHLFCISFFSDKIGGKGKIVLMLCCTILMSSYCVHFDVTRREIPPHHVLFWCDKGIPPYHIVSILMQWGESLLAVSFPVWCDEEISLSLCCVYFDVTRRESPSLPCSMFLCVKGIPFHCHIVFICNDKGILFPLLCPFHFNVMRELLPHCVGLKTGGTEGNRGCTQYKGTTLFVHILQ